MGRVVLFHRRLSPVGQVHFNASAGAALLRARTAGGYGALPWEALRLAANLVLEPVASEAGEAPFDSVFALQAALLPAAAAQTCRRRQAASSSQLQGREDCDAQAQAHDVLLRQSRPAAIASRLVSALGGREGEAAGVLLFLGGAARPPAIHQYPASAVSQCGSQCGMADR